MKNIRNKLTFKALTLRKAAREKALALRAKALDTTGEGYVDTAVKIIIAVVIGALLMAGLVALFNEVIMPRVNTEVTADGTSAPEETPETTSESEEING